MSNAAHMNYHLELSSKVEVFRCPRCREVINTSMDRCGFCGVGIDRYAAQEAVVLQRKVNRAIENASYARILAGILPLIYIAGVKELSTPIIIWGTVPLLVGFPVHLARGWWMYRQIPPGEPGIRKARNHLIQALGIWFLTGAAWIVAYAVVGYPPLPL
ncbi:MAG: hypothetical protein ACE145_21390 [Terriglobia bacterium]